MQNLKLKREIQFWHSNMNSILRNSEALFNSPYLILSSINVLLLTLPKTI